MKSFGLKTELHYKWQQVICLQYIQFIKAIHHMTAGEIISSQQQQQDVNSMQYLFIITTYHKQEMQK